MRCVVRGCIMYEFVNQSYVQLQKEYCVFGGWWSCDARIEFVFLFVSVDAYGVATVSMIH